ncbi:MAG: hypothetical protein L0H83_00450 [Salinisphaera sp.]|nr:hypothetical protein [Salinisphaera sp.]
MEESSTPRIVSHDQWEGARAELLVREKAHRRTGGIALRRILEKGHDETSKKYDLPLVRRRRRRSGVPRLNQIVHSTGHRRGETLGLSGRSTEVLAAVKTILAEY